MMENPSNLARNPLHGDKERYRYKIGQTSVYQIIADYRKQADTAAA
jgi:hypothetical protein